MQYKVCFFNQSSVHYRKNIFMLMDQELGIDFYFGDSRKQGAIKELDTSCLKHFKGYFHNIGFGPLYWQNGAIRLLWSDYTDLFTTATHYCLSAWVVLLLAPMFGKRVYLWSHGAYGNERGIKKWLTIWKMKRATGSLLYGNYAKRILTGWGVPEEKLHVFYNSLAYDEEMEVRKTLTATAFYQDHFHNDLPNLVFIGRLTAVKKLDMILQAMSLLRDRGIHVNMTYVGDGPKKAELAGECLVLRALLRGEADSPDYLQRRPLCLARRCRSDCHARHDLRHSCHQPQQLLPPDARVRGNRGREDRLVLRGERHREHGQLHRSLAQQRTAPRTGAAELLRGHRQPIQSTPPGGNDTQSDIQLNCI